MKYLVTIILSVSLYAPQAAKFMVYAEYAALAVAMTNQNWCDCMLTADTDTDGIPATEKQKDIQFKTDWKFTIEKDIVVTDIPHFAVLVKNGSFSFQLPGPFLTDVFYPPSG